MKNQARRRRPWIIAFILVLVAVAVYVGIRQRGNGAEVIEWRTALVKRGSVSAVVSATGALEPLTSVEVKSNVGGQVVELTVDEGDTVHAGQLLARIDPADQLSRVQQAQANLASAQAKTRKAKQQYGAQPKLTGTAIERAEHSVSVAKAALAQTKTATVPQQRAEAQASYDQAKAGYTQAQNDLKRQQALLKKGFVAKSQVEAAEEQYAVAKAQMDSAESRLKTVETETAQETKSAEAKLKEAQAALASAKANAYQVKTSLEDVVQSEADESRVQVEVDDARTQLEYTNIYAPRDGVVVSKYVETGSIITAGRSSFSGSGEGIGILEIADVTEMLATVDVDETDIAQVSVGQKVRVTVDAYPDEKFSGSVTRVAPRAVELQNVVYIPVEVRIDQSDIRLKPGLNVTCDFITKSKENALVVPNEAVKDARGSKMVSVLTDGKPQPRPVEIGVKGDHFTEILGGLREGDKAVLNAPEEPRGDDRRPRGPRMF